MKYKFEPFKDRKELFLWAAEGKPIRCNISGNLCLPFNDDSYSLHFNAPLDEYQKAIPVKTETVNVWLNFWYDHDLKGIITFSYDSETLAIEDAHSVSKQTFLKTEKFSTEIEVE